MATAQERQSFTCQQQTSLAKRESSLIQIGKAGTDSGRDEIKSLKTSLASILRFIHFPTSSSSFGMVTIATKLGPSSYQRLMRTTTTGTTELGPLFSTPRMMSRQFLQQCMT